MAWNVVADLMNHTNNRTKTISISNDNEISNNSVRICSLFNGYFIDMPLMNNQTPQSDPLLLHLNIIRPIESLLLKPFHEYKL